MPITYELSIIDPVNEALGQLGKDPIVDIEDTVDPVAVLCKRYFVSILRTMLRNHDWNFARARVELALNAEAPLFGFGYAFTLPADCFFVRRLNNIDDPGNTWRIEARNLLTHMDTAVVEYTRWIDDPNVWDSSFYQAFVTFLAVRLAPAFNVDVAKASDLYKVYQAQEMDAKSVDGTEGSQDQMSAPFYDQLRDV